MIYDFLTQEREAVLKHSKTLSTTYFGTSSRWEALKPAWSMFYDDLLHAVEEAVTTASLDPDERKSSSSETPVRPPSRYGDFGFRISEVVHSYGIIYQAINASAIDKGITMSQTDLAILNHSLDRMIAETVSTFQVEQTASMQSAEVERLGFLAHELRNALVGASLALEMIKGGEVNIRSATGDVLERSLDRMNTLIDTTLTEVRLKVAPTPQPQRLRIADVISEIEVTAVREAQKRGLVFLVEGRDDLMIMADRHLIVSAVANLVQNALKYTLPQTKVTLRTRESEANVYIEVEDACGGLHEETIEQLFQPFTQADADRTGLGLGLTISRRAVDLNNGKLYAENLPGQGCIFTIELPKSGTQAANVPPDPADPAGRT